MIRKTPAALLLLSACVPALVPALVPTTRADPTTRPTTRPSAPAEKGPAAFKTVGPDEFEKLAKEPNHVILDVRTPREFAAAHLPGAVNLDFTAEDFEDKIAALDRGKVYLVHCGHGGRGARACAKLSRLDFPAGLPHVYNLDGGLTAWEQAGKPVEEGKK